MKLTASNYNLEEQKITYFQFPNIELNLSFIDIFIKFKKDCVLLLY